jgi:hypothetical protein
VSTPRPRASGHGKPGSSTLSAASSTNSTGPNRRGSPGGSPYRGLLTYQRHIQNTSYIGRARLLPGRAIPAIHLAGGPRAQTRDPRGHGRRIPGSTRWRFRHPGLPFEENDRQASSTPRRAIPRRVAPRDRHRAPREPPSNGWWRRFAPRCPVFRQTRRSGRDGDSRQEPAPSIRLRFASSNRVKTLFFRRQEDLRDNVGRCLRASRRSGRWCHWSKRRSPPHE